MEKNFAIDQGNSRIKVATFNGDELIDVISSSSIQEIPHIQEDLNQFPTIISSVAGNPQLIKDIVSTGNNRTYVLDHHTSLPISNHYESKESLGMDRIAAVCGAKVYYPEANCLVVDFGTCITYDFINSENEYKGGAISPGMKMRFDAMHHFTKSLPQIEFEKKEAPQIGADTHQSMINGVINGIANEVMGFINWYKDQFEELEVLFCGGDSERFESIIKAPIFAAPNLVVVGLNSILRHNEDSK